jgi:Ubiquinol-cytochrome C chaperone
VGNEFRSRHTVLMTHVWMVHKRLLADDLGKEGRRIQECMFDELWEDTSNRIRAVGVNELSVNKYLKEVQSYSFKYCIELDHALSLSLGKQKQKGNGPDNAADGIDTDDEMTPEALQEKVKDEFGGALWRNVYNRRDEIDVDHVLEFAE